MFISMSKLSYIGEIEPNIRMFANSKLGYKVGLANKYAIKTVGQCTRIDL